MIYLVCLPNDVGRGEDHNTLLNNLSLSTAPTAADASCTIEMVEKRNVPIFCAVCLDSYEVSDQVCWASNKECTHVFHADCILQWLVSSGKKKSMDQIFEKHPSDAKLIQYRQCPCCRQDFISVKPDIREREESV